MQENAERTHENRAYEGPGARSSVAPCKPDAGFSASFARLRKNPDIILILLVLADGFVTLWGLGTGRFSELNPVAKSLLLMSPLIFLAVKFTSLGVFIWVTKRLPTGIKTPMYIILIVAYSLILTSNAYTILREGFHV